MSVTIQIPTPLRPMAGGLSQVEVGGTTVNEALAALEDRYNGIRHRICQNDGEVPLVSSTFMSAMKTSKAWTA